MAYIGKQPAAAVLAASDITDGIISTAKIADTAITNAKLNADIISADTALGATPADTDEFLVSDAGVLKRMDYSHIKAGGAWNFIKSQTASGAASVEFKNGVSDVVLDSTYIMYKLISYDMTATADDSNTLIQLSTDAGSSYITSGYDTLNYRSRSDTSGVLTETTGAMQLNNLGNSTNEEGAFEWNIINPSSGTTFAKYWYNAVTRDASARVGHFNGGGMYEATSDIDALKVLQNSGNISGTFKLYGLSGS